MAHFVPMASSLVPNDVPVVGRELPELGEGSAPPRACAASCGGRQVTGSVSAISEASVRVPRRIQFPLRPL